MNKINIQRNEGSQINNMFILYFRTLFYFALVLQFVLFMLRTIILEDEPEVLNSLEIIVDEYCKNLYYIGSASTIKQGREIIKKYQPDLVLLDIKFPDGTAFDLLESLEEIDFKIIFITAYNHFALEAFRYNAIDYLLKPIDTDDLQEAVSKAEALHSQEKADIKLKLLLKTVRENGKSPDQLVLHTKTEFHIVKLSDIYYLEADRNRTVFYIKNDKTVAITSQFNEYVNLLGESGFVKIHRCFMINLNEVKSFIKRDGGYVVMNNNGKIPLTIIKKEDLLKLIPE